MARSDLRGGAVLVDQLDFGRGLSLSRQSISGDGPRLQFAGGVSILDTGLTIIAGGFTVTAGGLTVTAGGFTVSDGASTMTDNAAATTAGLTLVNATATQSSVRALDLQMDDGANGVDNDTVYLSYTAGDDSQVQVEIARVHGVFTDVSGSADGAVRLSAQAAGTMTDVMEIGYNTAGTFVMAFGDAVGTPVIQQAWTTTNGATDRSIDVDVAAEVGDGLHSLIVDLQALGLIT